MFEKFFCKTDKSLRMLCIADTHGDMLMMTSDSIIDKFRDVDVVICVGDIRKDELKVISRLSKNKILAIKGNHDSVNQFDELPEIIDIHNNMVDINGVNIIGIEGSIKYNDCVVGFSQKESLHLAKSMQKGADILISHSHMYCKDDAELGPYNSHVGLKGTRYYFRHNRCVNIHGHDHISTELKNPRELRLYGMCNVLYKNGKLSLL